MAVRNSKELGNNLFLIAKRLLSNNNLCRLLINIDKNPLENEVLEPLSLMGKQLLIVPKVNEKDFNSDGKIVLLYPSGSLDTTNTEFKNVTLELLIYTPLSTWIINDENLRPFLVMSEIEESLKDKRMNGVGTLKYKGFEIQTLTDTLSCYKMEFLIDVFD